ncbi:MAG: hypothetical protein R3D46_00290 [Defluviimonas denitrificans]
MPEVRQPFAERPEWSVLVEIGLAPGQTRCVGFWARSMRRLTTGALSKHAVLAASEGQRQDL